MSKQANIELGPFGLREPIGEGGMGVVWRGVHRSTQRRVAIKVIRPELAQESTFRGLFRTEVASIARLRHPAIVTLLDHGEVDQSAEQASNGALQAASPYLVMDWIDGDPVSEQLGQLPWSRVVAILRSVLAALAHAHARGLLHLDVKPQNILVASHESVAPRVTLTDLGLARAFGAYSEDQSERLEIGTPEYMAPERFEMSWRNWGPATDLYGLGCVAYAMVTGEPPFRGLTYWDVGSKHLHDPPRPLPQFEGAPKEFGEWVARLLSKAPSKRFERAADALAALDELVASTGDEASASERGHAQRPVQRPAQRLLGAGLRLFELQTIPFVGRVNEREHLERELAAVEEHCRARVVQIRGSAGVGKSRLCEWFCHQSDERGQATFMRVQSGPDGSANGALASIAESVFRTAGLDRPETVARVADGSRKLGLSGSDSAGLANLLCPLVPGRFTGLLKPRTGGGQAEQLALLARLATAISETRPLVLWFDDAHWAPDALELATYLLTNQDVMPCSVLILMVVREEALAIQPREAELLGRLAELDGVSQLLVGPFSDADQGLLLHAALGLETPVVSRLIARTRGNPLFAVELVSDWIGRGALTLKDTGLSIPEVLTETLPDDVRDIWEARIERVLAPRTEHDRRALEIAAVLGHDVHFSEWYAVCPGLETRSGDALVAELVEERLVKTTERGWSFAHAMLRETVEQMAETAGRRREHHATCAHMLEPLFEANQPRTAGRLGVHLLLAGQPAAAVDPLLAGAAEHWERSEYPVAESLLERSDAAFCGFETAVDSRMITMFLLRHRNLVSLGQPTEAVPWADRAINLARENGWPIHLANALCERGWSARAGGRPLEGIPMLREACILLEKTDEWSSLAEARNELADQLVASGQLDEALSLLGKVEAACRANNEERSLGVCLHSKAIAALNAGETDDASALFAEALALHQAHGKRYAMAGALNGLAEIDRKQGSLQDAERGYRKAQELYEEIGAQGARIIPLLNRALVLIEDQKYSAASQALTSAMHLSKAHGRRNLLGAAHANMLPCVAAAGDWSQWSQHVELAQTILSESGMVDPDIAWPAELAGDLAAAAGRGQEARAAFGLALGQWEGLSRVEDAQRVGEKQAGASAQVNSQN